MCGIFGTINIEGAERALAALQHRGPDSHGLECLQCAGQRVWLGHTRLSILDLSPAGHQPMQSRDGRWWISFNGEIYNHLDLRQALSGPFRGHSDTETLVELLASHGVKRALPKLNGMFAFAALDTRDKKLYLARDPFGIKPLYYAHQENHFAFASEVRGLKLLGLTGGLDPQGLRQFLTLRYVPSPATLWRNVMRLPPGHLLCLDLIENNVQLSRYVKPTDERFSGVIGDAIDAYQEQLLAAVKRQLLSDVPVGILLSSGVDSALVAAMAKEEGADLPCFTVGFGSHYAECEIKEAAHTAKVLGLPFYSVTVTPDQLQESLPSIVRSVEEPLGTTSIMPMGYLVRRAQEDVKVVLTGQGSDEPWGGYYRYQVELVRQRLPLASFWKLGRWFGAWWKNKSEMVERGVRTLAEGDPARRIMEACALFPAHERRQLLGDDYDGGAEAQIRSWLAWLDDVGKLPDVERMMRLDTRMNLADDLLLYGDKISMAVSVEARVPMLDLELVRFVESLPIGYRIRWQHGKLVHKMMAERYLPHAITHRPKKGFQVPFGKWSRGVWKPWVEALLLEGLGDLLRRKALERLWQEHLDRRPDRSRQIFSLVMLSLWRQEAGA